MMHVGCARLRSRQPRAASRELTGGAGDEARRRYDGCERSRERCWQDEFVYVCVRGFVEVGCAYSARVCVCVVCAHAWIGRRAGSVEGREWGQERKGQRRTKLQQSSN